jgi:hypothetical protein
VINPIDIAGSLTDGKGQTQQWTVVPDSHRITLQYQYAIFTWCADCDGRAICDQGGITAAVTAKNCSSPEGPLQPFFRNKKSQAPYLQTHVFPTFEQFS